MKLLVLGRMPATTLELLNKLYMMGGGEIEVRVLEDMKLTGKRPEMVIIDEVTYDPMGVLDIVKNMPEPIRAETAYADRNRPRTKADRHRNKRYRWSSS